MKTRANTKANVSLLNAKIEILNKSGVRVPQVKVIFTKAARILTLVRDKFPENEDSIRLTDSCFCMCEALNESSIQRSGLNESGVVALEETMSVMCEIERSLRREASTPLHKHSKNEVYLSRIERALDVLRAPSPSPEGPSLADDRETTRIFVSGSASASGRLISRAFTADELPTLMEAIISSQVERDAVRTLRLDDAQTFIDAMDEGLNRPDLSSLTRKRCLKLMYKTCRHYALLPKDLKVPICYDRTADPLYHGGYGDVWKGGLHNREVAVKVIRTCSSSDLAKVVGRFCKEVVAWKYLRHSNVLPLIGIIMSGSRFAMVSDWMANGNIHEFMKIYPDVDRVGLLTGVTEGLIYLHDNGMVHGDLKGANILIDPTGQACLADFGFLSIISDPANQLSSTSCTPGGTSRWMSPELISPSLFGLNGSRTKSSDCYALGMVIYETLSGKLPFHKDSEIAVIMKVMKGEIPTRDLDFPDYLWGTMEMCWAYRPTDRPSIRDVLGCLWMGSSLSKPSTAGSDGSASASPLNHTFSSVSSASRPPAVRLTIVDGADNGEPDLNLSISPTGSNGGPTYQDRPTTPSEVTESPRSDVEGADPHHRANFPGSASNYSEEDVVPHFDPIQGYHLSDGTPAYDLIPQAKYVGVGSRWGGGIVRPPVSFLTWGRTGVEVLDAMGRELKGLDNPDDSPLDTDRKSIIIRIHFPGYPSSSSVQKTLKELSEKGEKSKARSMQLVIRNSKSTPGPITRRRLVHEVSKRIKWYVEVLETNGDVFQFDSRVGEKWRLGQGRMEVKYMVITELVNVSAGSWSPTIYIKRASEIDIAPRTLS